MNHSLEKSSVEQTIAKETAAQRLGQAAENQAAEMLKKAGCHILTRNYRCRRGEIDLIALEVNTLLFVEVRFRSPSRFGGAAASVTARKQRRTVIAAQRYLQQNPGLDRPCRFDVIAIDGPDSVNWIKHAYSL